MAAAEPGMNIVCASCGYHGPRPTYGPVRIAIVVLLGIFACLPGILYALYVEHQVRQCPRCQNKTLIPDNSPRAGGVAIAPVTPSSNTGAKVMGGIVGVALLGMGGCFALAVLTPDAPPEARPPAPRPKVERRTPMIDATPRQAAEPVPVVEPAEPAPAESPESLEARRAKVSAELAATRSMRSLVLDPTVKVYHVPDCPDAAGLHMRASLAIATMQDYTAHECATAAKE